MTVDRFVSKKPAVAAPHQKNSNDSADLAGPRKCSHDRGFRRARTLLTGDIIALGVIVNILVHDLSANGARIRLKGRMPDASTYRVRGNGAGQVRATMRWRNGDMLGVQFMEKPSHVVRNLDGRLRNILAQ